MTVNGFILPFPNSGRLTNFPLVLARKHPNINVSSNTNIFNWLNFSLNAMCATVVHC